MYLCYEDSTKELITRETLDKLKEAKEIILFGAGRTGDYFFKVLKRNKIIPKCFCDNYKNKQGTIRNKLPVLSFDEAIEKYPEAVIFITSVYYEIITADILKKNSHLKDRIYSSIVSMSWEILNKQIESEEKQYIMSNQKCFEVFYERLADYDSKKTLEGILNYRLTRKLKYITDIISKEETYFDSQVIQKEVFTSPFVFIDGGSSNGDTILALINNAKTNYSEIHCYEADKECICELEKLIEEKRIPRIIIHKMALWNEKAKLQFQMSGAGGSSISKKNESTVEVEADALDSLELQKVNFIKLDIEGAESKALEGMKKTIQRCQPILAISAYHKQEDLIVLSEFINSIGVDYEMFLRHYMNAPVETILYAIPRRK